MRMGYEYEDGVGEEDNGESEGEERRQMVRVRKKRGERSKRMIGVSIESVKWRQKHFNKVECDVMCRLLCG